MNKFVAQKYAISALSWLGNNPTELENFLTECGASVGDLRQASTQPEFLVSVLDFFLTSDKLVVELSSHLDVLPQEIIEAREHLPGGNNTHWT
ncbi:MAG: DUF3572 domain-containing protein [Pseudomonadota bacterium]|nr:DUF3572 domain-containing protein [Pseudomonadota bacterium]